ncbi:MAG: hypothetical protein IPL49_18140 [Saprospirales bacterium]|nr:hypothetical protein [Saprospirales bacterium]
MKNLSIFFLLLASFSLHAQRQTNADFSVDCPCTLEAQQSRDVTTYSCVEFYKNVAYKVEVVHYPNGIPDGLTEREHLEGYYRDLVARDITPELVTFRDNLAVLYRVSEPLSVSQMIISDNIVFFWKDKRYTLIVTTVSGTRRTLFQDFTNSFELK